MYFDKIKGSSVFKILRKQVYFRKRLQKCLPRVRTLDQKQQRSMIQSVVLAVDETNAPEYPKSNRLPVFLEDSRWKPPKRTKINYLFLKNKIVRVWPTPPPNEIRDKKTVLIKKISSNSSFIKRCSSVVTNPPFLVFIMHVCYQTI